MVQIIQSEPTQRQSALEMALGQALQGFGSSFAQGQQTQRQQALADNQLKLKLYDMGVANPDQALAQLKGEYKQTEIAPAQPAQYGQELAGPVMPGQSPLKELLSAPVPAQMSPVNPLGTYSEAKMSEMAAKKQLEMLDQEAKRADINYKTQQGNKLETAVPLEREKTFAEIRKLNAETNRAGKESAPGMSKFDQKLREVQGVELAKKTTGLYNVKNAMDRALVQLNDPNKTEEEKIKIGQGLLKLLNSAEGSDAVGAEESKRIGDKLEFALGNFTGVGGMRVGRDLPGFIDQVRNNSELLGERVREGDRGMEAVRQGIPLSQVGRQAPLQTSAQAPAQKLNQAELSDYQALKAKQQKMAGR